MFIILILSNNVLWSYKSLLVIANFLIFFSFSLSMYFLFIFFYLLSICPFCMYIFRLFRFINVKNVWVCISMYNISLFSSLFMSHSIDSLYILYCFYDSLNWIFDFMMQKKEHYWSVVHSTTHTKKNHLIFTNIPMEMENFACINECLGVCVCVWLILYVCGLHLILL